MFKKLTVTGLAIAAAASIAACGPTTSHTTTPTTPHIIPVPKLPTVNHLSAFCKDVTGLVADIHASATPGNDPRIPYDLGGLSIDAAIAGEPYSSDAQAAQNAYINNLGQYAGATSDPTAKADFDTDLPTFDKLTADCHLPAIQP